MEELMFSIYIDLEWNACQTYLLRTASLPVAIIFNGTHTKPLTSTAFSHCGVLPSSLDPDKYFICKPKAIQRTPTWRSSIFFVMLGPNSFYQRLKAANRYLGARH